MSNTGVSQYSFDVGLPQSHKISHNHGQNTDDPEGPKDGLSVESHFPVGIKDSQENGKAYNFGPHRVKGCHRSGSSFIDIGCPHMERHYSDLEAKPNDDQTQSN